MKLITRHMWGAKPAKRQYSKMGEIKGLVVHWSYYPGAIGNQAEIDQLKNIQQLHQETRNWNDIAYNFLIGNTGQIYEGRGFDARPASQGTPDGNFHYYSVCWLGGKPPTLPSDKALESINLLHEQIGGKLKKHSDFKATTCPGPQLSDYVDGQGVVVDNKQSPEMIHPQFIQKKLDTIIAKLENIENKLKLGNLIK